MRYLISLVVLGWNVRTESLATRQRDILVCGAGCSTWESCLRTCCVLVFASPCQQDSIVSVVMLQVLLCGQFTAALRENVVAERYGEGIIIIYRAIS